MKKLNHISIEQWASVCDLNKTILQDFLINSTELSPKTRSIYESNLRIWFFWVYENLNNKSQIEIKPLEYKKFQNWMVNRGCSSSDVDNKRAAISSINGYLEIYYHDEYPHFRNFINKSIKRPQKSFVYEKEPLTKDEFNHLIKVLQERGEFQKIAYLMFTLDTGCRRAESRQLLKSIVDSKPIRKMKKIAGENDVGTEKEIIYYQTHPIRCKGSGSIGKIRRFVFGTQTMQAIKKWIDKRGIDDCEYMFVSKYGGEIRQVSETLFNTWATGTFSEIIGRRAYPHQLRSSRASQLAIEDGVDIKIVQKLLGHESVTTTEIYVVRDDSDDLDELYIEKD